MKTLLVKTVISIGGLTVFSLGLAAQSPVSSSQYPHGFYIGAQLGSTETHYGLSGFDNTDSNNAVQNGTVTSSGFGQRGLIGYRFTKYVAAEAGYTHYDTAKGDNLSYGNNVTGQSGKIKEQSFDLYVKGILPLAEEVDVYAKLGAAAISSKVTSTEGFSKSRSATRPAFGGGATYNIAKDFATDVSYSRVQGSGRIKSADFVSVGFYYYFS